MKQHKVLCKSVDKERREESEKETTEPHEVHSGCKSTFAFTSSTYYLTRSGARFCTANTSALQLHRDALSRHVYLVEIRKADTS